MTFADKTVAKSFADYALAWKNIKDEEGAGASFKHDPDDEASEQMRGIGNHNVQLLFLTSKGELLHALAGFWSAKDLLRELDLVKELVKAAKEGKEKVAELHKAHAKEDAEKLGDGSCGLMDQKTMKWLEETQ